MNADAHFSVSGTPVPVCEVGLPFQVPLNPKHLTKEEIGRATETLRVHHFLCHPSDDALKLTLDQGLLSRHSNLTGADVDLMTKFFASCLAYTAGKLHCKDLHATSNTQALTFVDDYSHYTSVLGSKSKNHDDVLTCLRQLISSYNAQGHSITSF